ncbi:MAG: GGDEF domain-containing protein, partial [Steroidobacteraceae bacterium]|nr:GGDEF domain-containing protein [Steroidobacteraceae bacterium]
YRHLAESLLAELRAVENDAQLAKLVRQIADALQERRAELERERHQANALLTEVTARLDEVSRYLAGQNDDRRLTLGDAEQLNERVLTQVDAIRSEVGSATNLATLKTQIGNRLESIAAQVREFRDREEHRFLEQTARNQQMAARIAELERQTSDLHRSLHREQRRARLDALTGIANRSWFDERLAEEIARWRRFRTPVSVLVWDIDRFKSINDRYGHRSGDIVLQEVAKLFTKRLRSTDVLARYGGEEFVMLLIGTPLAAATALAENLRVAVSQLKFHFRGTPVVVTASCGITELRDGDQPESVFDRADAAMYRAKNAGRNQCIAA